jgi:hypothetical protein
MGRLRRILTMDANEAMDAVGVRYLALFRRHPVRMHLVAVGVIAGVLVLAWHEGGRGFLVAIVILWLGLFVLLTLVSLTQALLRKARKR